MGAEEPLVAMTINGFYGRGGTERQIVDVAAGLRQRGREVVVMSRWPLDPESENIEELQSAGVRVISRGAFVRRPSRRRRLAARWRMLHTGGDPEQLEAPAWEWQRRQLEQLAKRHAVVVHEVPYFGQMAAVGRAIHEALRLPVVHTVLGTPSDEVVPAAPWAVVTSDGAPRVRQETRYSWIPCMSPPPVGVVSTGQRHDDGPLAVLYVGRLVPSKGVDLLLEAVRDFPGVHLSVVGDGQESGRLRAAAAPLGARVRFAGSLDRAAVSSELRKADIVAVPSRKRGVELMEGMPTVVAEALGHGVPIIASAVGGIPKVFDGPDEPGWLVAPDDSEAIRMALASAERSSLAVCSASAQRTYERLLQPRVVLDAYQQAYVEATHAAPMT